MLISFLPLYANVAPTRGRRHAGWPVRIIPAGAPKSSLRALFLARGSPVEFTARVERVASLAETTENTSPAARHAEAQAKA